MPGCEPPHPVQMAQNYLQGCKVRGTARPSTEEERWNLEGFPWQYFGQKTPYYPVQIG